MEIAVGRGMCRLPLGSEAGVVCLSFVAFLDSGSGGGFSGRETKEES